SSLSASSGTTAGGTTVTISGSNFSGATRVDFGGVPAAFTVNGDSSITAVSPVHASGTIDVTVTTANGTSSTGTATHFTYSAATGSPTVTSLGTTTGPTGGGTSVTITGTNFSDVTGVAFGGVQATSYVVNSATSITAVGPAGGGGGGPAPP